MTVDVGGIIQERAYEHSQKYKEGKSILEKALLLESTPVGSNSEDPSSPAQLVSLGTTTGDEGSVSGRSSLSTRSMSFEVEE